MSRIYTPSIGPDAWRVFLAQPELHWQTGFSAKTLAHSWEAVGDGAPPEVAATLQPALGPVELLFAWPEHKTPLPGGDRASQTDVLTLFRTARGTALVGVEGKVDEPFGPIVSEWLRDASPGKQARLAHLRALLGLEDRTVDDVAYQLLHRTAAALIEARRFAAADAVMLVHSFSPGRTGWPAFARFAALFGQEPTPGAAVPIGDRDGIALWLAWTDGDPRFLTC